MFARKRWGKTKAKKDDLDSTVEKMTTKINQDSSKSVELKSDACYYKMSRISLKTLSEDA